MPPLLIIGLENAAAAALLALPVAVVGACLRRRPALVHALWLFVLIKLVTPPVWRVPVAPTPPTFTVQEEIEPTAAEDWPALLVESGEFGPEDAASEGGEVAEPGLWARCLAPLPEGWLWGLAGVWGAGTLVVAAVSAARIARFRAALRAAEDAPDDLAGRVEALAARIGLARAPAVVTFPGGLSPMVWALGGRPTLVIPLDLWKGLAAAQRDTLLVHELAHLRRRDHWARWLELVVAALYWWLPVAWWARRQLREAEERCCDAWVVWALPGSARAYAETLLDAVDYLSDARAAAPSWASGLGGSSRLKRRLIMIFSGGVSRSLGWGGRLSALGLAAALLPWSPALGTLSVDDTPKKFIVVREDVKGAPARVEAGLDLDKSGKYELVTEDVIGDNFVFVDVEDGKQPGADEKAGEVDRVIEKLTAELKALRAKGETDQAKALAKAIDQLKVAAAKKGKPGESKQVIVKRFTLRSDGDAKAEAKGDGPGKAKADESDEKSAELKKLTEEVEANTRAVQDATKRLAEARQRLAEARRKLAGAGPLHSRTFTFQAHPEHFGTWTQSLQGQKPIVEYRLAPGTPTMNLRALTGGDQEKRIAELEKKLEKVISQLESLKKGGESK